MAEFQAPPSQPFGALGALASDPAHGTVRQLPRGWPVVDPPATDSSPGDDRARPSVARLTGRALLSSRLWIVAMVALCAAAVALVVHPVNGLDVVEIGGGGIAGLIIAVNCIVIPVSRRRFGSTVPSRFLVPTGVGLLVFVESALLERNSKLHGVISSPSAPQLLAFVGYCWVIAGLAGLIRLRLPRRALAIVVESVIVAVVVGTVIWLTLVDPKLHRVGATVGGLRLLGGSALLTTALPVLDVTIMAMLIRMARKYPKPTTSDRLLTIGFGALLGSHLLGVLAIGGGQLLRVSTVAPLQMLAFAFWAAGALHPSLRDRVEPVLEHTDQLHTAHLMGVAAAVLVIPSVLTPEIVRHAGLNVPIAAGIAAGPAFAVIAYLMRLVNDRARHAQRALHDDLTGLPNRVLLREAIDAAMASAQFRQDEMAVMYLDLDRFKGINDSLGHAAGDQVLKNTADRLRTAVRSIDTVARFGGDEFVLLLPQIKRPSDWEMVATRVVEALSQGHKIGEREVFTGTSVGVAVFPNDGQTAETLIKNADAAMYQSKEAGGNCFTRFTANVGDDIKRSVMLENGLRRAVERGELVVHYQPKLTLATGRVSGVEALVRWEHPEFGLILPDEFISLAEHSGMIDAIGEWVFDTAARQVKEWHRQGFDRLSLAVNMSPRQFERRNAAAVVARVLRTVGIAPHLVEVELTETRELRDLEDVVMTLREIRELGVRCSIDDFGTGYSGLHTLTLLPIDSIKIDREFISKIGRDAGSARVVEHMIRLGHSMNLEVTAEGVESEEQLVFLYEHRCDQVQGFLFSSAVPATQLESLLWREQRIAAQRQPA